MSEPKPSIPKFGSFKPKPIHITQDPVEIEAKENRRSKGGHGRGEVPDHRERHKSRRSYSKERRRERSNVRHTGSHAPRLEQRKAPPGQDESTAIFTIDRKGDPKNIEFGSVHRYVPGFYRRGVGYVLGAPSQLRIDKDYEDEKAITLSDRRALGSSRREKYVFSKLERERPRLLKIRPETAALDTAIIQEAGFIFLQSSRSRKRERGCDVSGSESETKDYRSIHGKAVLQPGTEPEDKDLQYATDSGLSVSENERSSKDDSSTRAQNVELSRIVEQNPADVSAWLALIEHQETMNRASGDQRRLTNAEVQSTAEIKIHMYEKALEKTRSLSDRELLFLGMMTEGTKVWEVLTQCEKWEKISAENIKSVLLWKSFLHFKQTTFGAFQYEELRDIMVQRIKLLLHALEATSDMTLWTQTIYVVLRLTTFMRESGYTEQAVGIWKAVLEFNMFAPPVSPGEKIELFKEFWESEVPRIGEEAALGWSHFVQSPGVSEAPDPVHDSEGDTLDKENIFQSWAVAEQTRCNVSRLPARTMDEVLEDDSFRVILISDIEEFLISFPAELRSSLIDAFLLFCKLPPSQDIDTTVRAWANDPFVGAGFLEAKSEWIRRQYLLASEPAGEEEQIRISSIFQTPLTNFQSSPESIFGLSWFQKNRSWQELFGGDHGPVKYEWLRNGINQILQVHFTEDLAEYYMAFQWKNAPTTIKKISRSLLKQHPSSLRLYNAYGLIEWARGNAESANGVVSAALDMSKSQPNTERDASIILWKSWIWAYCEDKDNGSALIRLLSIESGVLNDRLQPSPFQLLRTRQYLEQRRDYNLYSGGKLQLAIIFAELLAILSYLSSKSSVETQSNTQGDITSALAGYNSFSNTLSKIFIDRNTSDSGLHELFLQSAARLLYHHCSIGPFRPAFLREHLTNYLAIFPQNTIFLSLYTFNESRLRIDNRVRNILSSSILTPTNDILSSRLFAVRYEIIHGNIHSARAAFEHAVAAPSSKSSPGLWKLFMLYIFQTPQFLSQAKDIWYRAVRACPWSKALFILGFERRLKDELIHNRLAGQVEFGELQSTWKVMSEKGLRVHVDLEDAFEEMEVLEGSSQREIAHRYN